MIRRLHAQEIAPSGWRALKDWLQENIAISGVIEACHGGVKVDSVSRVSDIFVDSGTSDDRPTADIAKFRLRGMRQREVSMQLVVKYDAIKRIPWDYGRSNLVTVGVLNEFFLVRDIALIAEWGGRYSTKSTDVTKFRLRV